MTLFISQYCIHVLLVCAYHNSFDLPMLDFVVSKSFLLIILCGKWFCVSV
jgi:hypothetical protein